MEEINISQSSNKINKNITLDDITVFYKDRFIDFTQLPSCRYNLITNINLSNNLKFLGKIDSNDIWLETDNNIYLCGLQHSPTRSWYKIKDISDIDTFQNYYEKTILKEPKNILRFGIKLNNNLNQLNQFNQFNQFAQFIFFNQFTYKNICESQRDLNYSIKDTLITLEDQIRIFNNFIKLDINSFYIKTKYSKSILFCEKYDDYIIVNVLYNELNLKNRYEKYPNNLPSDISIIFNSFDKIFYLDILELLKKDNISSLNEININMYIDILFKICDNINIKKDVNLKDITSIEVKQYIKSKFLISDSDNVFNKIEKEGVFKAFENSFDILIQTFYEKINQSDKSDKIDSLYLNKKLKNRIDDIFKNKLL